MKKTLMHGLATWFGLGDLPKAPGTYGTLGAIPFYLIILSFRFIPFFNSNRMFNSFYFIVLMGFFALSLYVSDYAEKEMYMEKDPQNVVIDEVLGFLTTMFLVNPQGAGETFTAVVIGFILFRFFDITKLGPIGKSQKYGNGLGVVIDDFIAGVFANFILMIFMTLIFKG